MEDIFPTKSNSNYYYLPLEFLAIFSAQICTRPQTTRFWRYKKVICQKNWLKKFQQRIRENSLFDWLFLLLALVLNTFLIHQCFMVFCAFFEWLVFIYLYWPFEIFIWQPQTSGAGGGLLDTLVFCHTLHFRTELCFFSTK